MQGQQQTAASYITELSPADVLFGRGSGPNDHEGNVWFRSLVAARKSEYMATNHRMTKAKIAREIVDQVLAKKGRFLRKMEAVDAQRAGVPDGVDAWIGVDDDTIMEKAKQALRQNTNKNKGAAGAGPGGTTAVGSPVASSKAKVAGGTSPVPPSMSAAVNSMNPNHSNQQSSLSSAHHQQEQLRAHVAAAGAALPSFNTEDFEPIPITAGSGVPQQHQQQGGVGARPVSLQPSGDGYSYVVSPTNQQQQQQQQTLVDMGPGMVTAAALSTATGSADVDAAAAAYVASVQQQMNNLSQMVAGPPPLAQQQQQLELEQQQLYQHRSQQEQLQNKYAELEAQQQAERAQHGGQPRRRSTLTQRRGRESPRESLTIKEVFGLGGDGTGRRNSQSMEMSELMDSFREAKLADEAAGGDGDVDGDGKKSDQPDAETAKRLMASTETMGTIENYAGGGISYADMSLATMNSSTFSFMRADDSVADGAAGTAGAHPTSLTAAQSTSTASSNATGSSMSSGGSGGVAGGGVLSGKAIRVPTKFRSSTDSAISAGFRDSMGSVKSIHSEASISLSDLGGGVVRRKSGAVTSSLRGVSEEHEAAFGQEGEEDDDGDESAFPIPDSLADVDPLPLAAQQSGMSTFSSVGAGPMGNSSISMLKGMLMSTDEMGHYIPNAAQQEGAGGGGQDVDQQQQRQQQSNS